MDAVIKLTGKYLQRLQETGIQYKRMVQNYKGLSSVIGESFFVSTF